MASPVRSVKEVQHRELPVRLSAAEVAQRADDMAVKLAAIGELEERRKNVAAEFKEQIDTLRTEVGLLARQVRERSEQRDVECDLLLDFEAGTAELVRRDTGEVLGSRPLSPAEKQGNLFHMSGRDAAAGSDD